MKALLLALVLSASPLLAQSVPAPPFRPSERILVLEVTVPGPKAEVWRAFSTSEGLSTWLTPGAIVDQESGPNGY
jgi:hypothetical protein